MSTKLKSSRSTYTIVVDNLRLKYRVTNGSVNAINGISFKIKPGEVLGIVGESGCGKTSIALSLIKLLPKNVSRFSGQISLQGKPVKKISEKLFRKQIRWKKISMVFQGAMNSLNPVIRVGNQIIEPLILNKHDKNLAKEKAIELLKLVDLSEDTYSKYPHELSGGMKQRIIIAMSLIYDPDLIILDEPTSALDVSVQAQIMNLLKNLKKRQISMIFITHDIALASDLCDNIAVMKDGIFVEHNSIDKVLTKPQHHFTKKLLSSVPRLKTKSKYLTRRKSFDTILKLEKIFVDFPVRKGLLKTEQFRAVSDVSLDIKKGETFALVGESGSGKTTIGRVALRLISPTSGTVKFQNKLISNNYSELFDFRKNIQAIFQDPYSSISSFMNIYQIIEEPLIIHKIGEDTDRLEIITKALTDVNLTPVDDFLYKYPHMLSGGQRQRVGIARSLVLDPKFIVADEPVSMIDASSRLDILNLLHNLQKTKGISFLYITHDIATARQFSDKIAVMFFGRIVEMGTSTNIVVNPLHPYTRSLIEAVPEPNPENRFRMRKVLSREIFHPNCTIFDSKSNKVIDLHIEQKKHKCKKQYPRFQEIKKNHYVACLL